MDKYRTNIYTSSYLFVSLLYSLCALYLLPRRFSVNDNIAFVREIESNGTTTFFSPLLGKCLSMAHVHISSDVSWYGIFIYACLIISHLLVTLTICRLNLPTIVRVIFLLSTLLLYTQFLLSTGYNSASILLAGSSVFAFIGLLNTNPKRIFLPAIILGVCLGVAYLIRSKGMYASLIFLAPTIALCLLQKRYRVIKAWSFLLLPLVVFMALDTAYLHWGTTKEHKEFLQWNRVRGQFHGFPVMHEQRNNAALLELNQWTENDYTMFSNFTFFDEKLYNIPTINTILKYPKPKDSPPGKTFQKRLLGKESFSSTYYPHVILISLCLALFISHFVPLKFRLCFPLYTLYFISVIVAMAYFLRFPVYIGYPLAYVGMLNILSVGFLHSGISHSLTPIRKIMLSAVTIGFVLAGQHYSFYLIEKSYETHVGSKRLYNNFKRINATKDTIDYAYLFPGGHGIQIQYMDPLNICQYDLVHIPAGWPTFSPRFYQSLEKVGLEHGYELIPSMIDNKKAVIIGSYNMSHLLLKYIEEKHQVVCQLTPMMELEGNMTVYYIVQQSEDTSL
ncbi:MAG: hypothetical protein JKY53_13305 [Flavobacteriales bacterium]|nr:hypothetical protein [Flavobacteriales bacterium]